MRESARKIWTRITQNTENALYLVRMRENAGKCEKNADQNNSEYQLFLRSVFNHGKTAIHNLIEKKPPEFVEICGVLDNHQAAQEDNIGKAGIRFFTSFFCQNI